MKYRTFGRTGFEVSEIAHGLWGMSGWSGSDDSESLAAMQLGIDDSVLRQGLGKAHVARGRCAFRRPVRRTRCRRRPGGPPDPRAGRDGAALSQRARR